MTTTLSLREINKACKLVLTPSTINKVVSCFNFTNADRCQHYAARKLLLLYPVFRCDNEKGLSKVRRRSTKCCCCLDHGKSFVVDPSEVRDIESKSSRQSHLMIYGVSSCLLRLDDNTPGLVSNQPWHDEKIRMPDHGIKSSNCNDQ